MEKIVLGLLIFLQGVFVILFSSKIIPFKALFFFSGILWGSRYIVTHYVNRKKNPDGTLFKQSYAYQREQRVKAALKEQAERRRMEEQRRAIVEAPLEMVTPSTAHTRPNEVAYAAVQATLVRPEAFGEDDHRLGVISKPIATGELVVTDQRILFASARKSFAVPFQSLISFAKYDNGCSLSDGRSTYVLSVPVEQNALHFGSRVDLALAQYKTAAKAQITSQ